MNIVKTQSPDGEISVYIECEYCDYSGRRWTERGVWFGEERKQQGESYEAWAQRYHRRMARKELVARWIVGTFIVVYGSAMIWSIYRSFLS